MSEASYYAERYFPEHGIRYLAPGNDFDSSGDNLMAPFQFAMNDVYLRDTSRKVKAVLNSKRSKGKYSACPPYGYRKKDRTTDELVPDENTAPIVQIIFALAADGMSTRSIANHLTNEGIMPPLKYRVECRDNFTERGASHVSDEWNYTTVKRILRNPVYLGHTTLGRTRKVSVKSKMTMKVPEEEWYYHEHTHEPLVTKEQFDRAEYNLGENTKLHASHESSRFNILAGLVFCANCGAAMCSGGSVYNGERMKYWYLTCNRLASRNTNRCEHPARIRYWDLLEVIRQDLNRLLDFTDEDIRAITDSAVAQAMERQKDDNREQQRKKIEQKLAHIEKMIIRLYKDNAAGNLDDDQLNRMMDAFGKESEALKRQSKLLAAQTEASEIRDAYEDFFLLAKQFTHVETLNREILHALIQRVEVGEKILPEGVQIAGRKTPYRQSIRIFYRFIGELSADPVREFPESGKSVKYQDELSS